MEQRTTEWHEARLGKITASRFSDVLTGGRGKELFGKTAMSYAYEIVSEVMTGVSKPSIKANALEWGCEYEAVAAAEYEETTFRKITTAGFLEYDDMVGGSPDGLIGKDGGIEIKCPYNSSVHLANAINRTVPPEYVPQVHGYMMITGRKWWDFVSYDPRYKKNGLVIVRVERDDDFIKTLIDRIEQFKEIINNLLEKVG